MRGINKMFHWPLKLRRRIVKSCLCIGVLLCAFVFFYVINIQTYPTSIHVKASKSNITKGSTEITEDVVVNKNKTYDKQLRSIYEILKDNQLCSYEYEDFISTFDHYDSQNMGMNSLLLLNQKVCISNWGKRNDENYAQKFLTLTKKGSDYVEAYDQLPKGKQQKIKDLTWKTDHNMLYAVNKNNKYENHSMQLQLGQLKVIKDLEKAGFTGIEQWVQTCEQRKDGILVNTVDGKQMRLHNTDCYQKFESNGVTFLFNYKEFKIMANSDIYYNRKQRKSLSRYAQIDEGDWTMDNYNTNGTYDEICYSISKENELCLPMNLKVIVKKQKVQQMNVCTAIASSYASGYDDKPQKKTNFYEKEKDLLREYMVMMGISKKEAIKWLDTFSFYQKEQEGKIGNIYYRVVKRLESQDYSREMVILSKEKLSN